MFRNAAIIGVGQSAYTRRPEPGQTVLHFMRDQIMPLTPLWRLMLGLSIIAMVLLFPRGLVGTLRHWQEQRA